MYGSLLEFSDDNTEEFGVEVAGPLSDGSESTAQLLVAHSGAFFFDLALEGEHMTRRYCWKEGVFFLARCFTCRLSSFFISLFNPEG